MAGSVSFSGQLTFEETLRVRRLLTRRKRSFIEIFMLVTTCICGAGMMAIIVPGALGTPKGRLELAMFIAVLAFIVGFIWLLRRFVTRTLRKRHEANPEPISGVATADGLQVHTKTANLEYEWNHFIRIKETEGLICLLDEDRRNAPFAAHMFASQTDWEQFKQLARTGVAAANAAQGPY
jgi:hypothetical protein